MLIISVRDHESNRRKRKAKNKGRKEQMSDTSYIKIVRAKWFCYAFKLGFIQSICKESLIFKRNLELTLSTIWKERHLDELKCVVVECRCLKIWDVLSSLIYSSFLVLNWQQVSLM